MSWFESYQFLSLHRVLNDTQRKALSTFSSRAHITAHRFEVQYNWGDFAGNVDDWLSRYFDLFLYRDAHQADRLMLAFDRDTINLDALQPYACEPWCRLRTLKRKRVVIDFGWEGEGPCHNWEEHHGWPIERYMNLHKELLDGDRRPLYLAWLASVNDDTDEYDEYDDEYDHEEDSEHNHTDPPCVPPGLDALSSAQQALSKLLDIKDPLREAAAAHHAATIPRRGSSRWASGPEVSAASLREEAQALKLARDEERRAQRARRKQELIVERREALARKLASMTQPLDFYWDEVEVHVLTVNQRGYEEATTLLLTLQQLHAMREPAGQSFTERLAALRARHRRKLNFLALLDTKKLC